MAKTVDELVRDVLGTQVIQICQLQAENALLTERIAQLTPPVPKPEPTHEE
jgi:sigma54-dependent transcription regulator